MKYLPRFVLLLVICFSLMACSSKGPPSDPVDNPSTVIDESITPEKGQPAFPKLGQYWVIDTCKCFSKEEVVIADQVFEQLRQDRIAEVVVICIKGVKNNGPMNDEKIWTMEWIRWAKLGDQKANRSLVWLIRPDVRPEENRVTVEISTKLYWWTALDYGPGLEEAANFVNYNNYDGALESIARTTDETLRKLWPSHTSE